MRRFWKRKNRRIPLDATAEIVDEPGEYEQGPLLAMKKPDRKYRCLTCPDLELCHGVAAPGCRRILAREDYAIGGYIPPMPVKPRRGLSPGTSAYWKRSPFDGRPN